MGKYINDEQIKSIENMISKKKNNKDIAFFYYTIIRVKEEEDAVYHDVVPYTKFKEPSIRSEFIKKWYNNFTAMALLDYYVARIEYEEVQKIYQLITE